MSEVFVLDLDDDVIDWHRRRAEASGISLEQQIHDVLTEAAEPTREELLAEARRCRATTPEPPSA